MTTIDNILLHIDNKILSIVVMHHNSLEGHTGAQKHHNKLQRINRVGTVGKIVFIFYSISSKLSNTTCILNGGS
jgi:hypothetical protein